MVKYCVACGLGAEAETKFCPNCRGYKFTNAQVKYCLECGTEMPLAEKSCPKCRKKEFCYTKEDYIKEVAEQYKKYIPQNLYEALYKWEVDIDD